MGGRGIKPGVEGMIGVLPELMNPIRGNMGRRPFMEGLPPNSLPPPSSLLNPSSIRPIPPSTLLHPPTLIPHPPGSLLGTPNFIPAYHPPHPHFKMNRPMFPEFMPAPGGSNTLNQQIFEDSKERERSYEDEEEEEERMEQDEEEEEVEEEDQEEEEERREEEEDEEEEEERREEEDEEEEEEESKKKNARLMKDVEREEELRSREDEMRLEEEGKRREEEERMREEEGRRKEEDGRRRVEEEARKKAMGGKEGEKKVDKEKEEILEVLSKMSSSQKEELYSRVDRLNGKGALDILFQKIEKEDERKQKADKLNEKMFNLGIFKSDEPPPPPKPNQNETNENPLKADKTAKDPRLRKP